MRIFYYQPITHATGGESTKPGDQTMTEISGRNVWRKYGLGIDNSELCGTENQVLQFAGVVSL